MKNNQLAKFYCGHDGLCTYMSLKIFALFSTHCGFSLLPPDVIKDYANVWLGYNAKCTQLKWGKLGRGATEVKQTDLISPF